MATVKKQNKTKQKIESAYEDVHRCSLECKIVKPLWKTAWWFLKKLKIELPYDSVILLLGVNPK